MLKIVDSSGRLASSIVVRDLPAIADAQESIAFSTGDDELSIVNRQTGSVEAVDVHQGTAHELRLNNALLAHEREVKAAKEADGAPGHHCAVVAAATSAGSWGLHFVIWIQGSRRHSALAIDTKSPAGAVMSYSVPLDSQGRGHRFHGHRRS